MKRDIWVFLFSLGLLAFCGPFLRIFRDHLAAYLFAIWFLFIGLVFLAVKFSDRGGGGS